ncbi:MAG TPA: hypothetical protein VHA55_00780 [Pseudorhodoplanes sp.]|jgi:hypothetical protein|nr:hypothetical protein [Pseudorhodoplanes sp.]
MRVLVTAAIATALLSPAAAQAPQQPETKEVVIGTIPGVAPEYQDAARKAMKARQKVAACQKEATEQKVLPRDRTQFVLACIDKLKD